MKPIAIAIVAGLSVYMTALPAQAKVRIAPVAEEKPAAPAGAPAADVKPAAPAPAGDADKKVDAPAPAQPPVQVAQPGAAVKIQIIQPAQAQPAQPAVQPAVARLVAKRPGGKAQREVQKNSLKTIADGGTFKMSDIVRFSLVDGRLKAEWVGNFPSNQAQRIKIEGSNATYVVTQFAQAPNSFYTMARYDFDAPEDEIWTVNMTVQQAAVSFYAQGGETCDVLRLSFSQQANMVTMSVTGWDNGRAKLVTNARSADLMRLRSEYPDEVRRYLAPLLRKVTGQPLLQPGPADAYRVFTQIPADPKVTSRIEALLPSLISSESSERETAAGMLAKLGAPGALAALRYDPNQLAPEQQTRLADLVTAHSRMTIDDPATSLADADFLLDCIESEDRTVRTMAKEALEKVLGRKVEIDTDAPVKKLEVAVDAVRKQVAKTRKPDEKKDAAQNGNVQPQVQILPAGRLIRGGGVIVAE